MVKAVLWDLDGTLVDSLPYHWDAWREIAAAEGLSVTHGQFIWTLGKLNDEILTEWSDGRLPQARRTELGLVKEARYRELLRVNGIAPLPGVVEWLERLRGAGWKQVVATSAPRLNEEAVMEALGLSSWFDGRVVAEDVTRGKPFPDVFLTAAARVGARPEHAVVVEDAVAGIQAGRAAGMKTIGVNAKPLPGADVMVASLLDLPADAFERLIGLTQG